MNNKVSRPFDRIDRKILAELQADGRITMVELAKRVGLSKTPCMERVRKLETSGVIAGYHAELAPEPLDAGHVAFVQVTLGNTTSAALDAFNAKVRELAEVQGCYMTAGPFDYLLKVRTADIKAYRRVLGEDIANLPHVVQTSTFVVMETVKDSLTLAL